MYKILYKYIWKVAAAHFKILDIVSLLIINVVILLLFLVSN